MLRRLPILLALLLVAGGLRAQEAIPEPMRPARLVNDFAALFTASERDALEERLDEFDRQTSTQIAVVTIADQGDYDAVDFAQRLHEKWGVGGRGRDNGIVILIKSKTDDFPGQAAISVGYGLEGVVPDITAGRIIDNEMLPAFRQGAIYKGVDDAASVLMQLTRGEFTADDYEASGGGERSAMLFGIGVIVLMLLLQIGRRRRGGGGNGWRGGGWIPPIIGGFGGGSSGGGGGFGGFGGGNSGGGGAGRSW